MKYMQSTKRNSDRLPRFMRHSHVLSYCLIVLLATLLFASGAHAAESPSELIGVWRGSIGKRQIIACWDTFSGSYYTLHDPLQITLVVNNQQPDVWLEHRGFETPSSWQLAKVVGNHLRGTWTNTPESPKQPIRLTRVRVPRQNKEEIQGCNSNGSLYEAFYAPRVISERIYPGKPATFMEKPYRMIMALGGKVVSVELSGEDESITHANALLRRNFTESIRSAIACMDDPQSPNNYWFQTKLRLRFWNDEWLSWSNHVEGYCGGAHPFFGSDPNTVDLRTGKEAKLWNWFKLVKKQADSPEQICAFLENRCLPARLAKQVREARASYEYKYCENIDFQVVVDGGYSIGLNEKGIAFVPIDSAHK
ncbi:MAG: hypothetical protein RJA63_3335 [Pseudomonadota bacterium]|jgi:hypothetical protein